MSWILSGLWGQCHGDLTQLVNSRLCVVVLFLLAATHVLLVSVYFPAAISCFCPSYMTDNQCVHIKQKCVANPEAIFRKTDASVYEDVGYLSVSRYYHYVTLILVLQAILFFIPSIIWKEAARKTGILPDELSISAVEARHTKNASDRESSVRLLAKHVQSFCTRQLHRRHVSYAFWWIHGNKLVIVQIVCKLAYAANVIGQFFLLDAFLGMPFHNYGWQLLGRVAPYFHVKTFVNNILTLVENMNFIKEGKLPYDGPEQNATISVVEEFLASLNETALVEFHREVMCETGIIQMGNVHRHSLECVLLINALNEIIFTIVWFLLFATSVVTIASLIHAVFTFVFFVCRRMSIRERLQDQGVLRRHDPREEETVREITTFERDFLQRDGLLLIGCIESAAGDIIADDVIKYLWEFYKENSPDLMMIIQRVTYEEEVDDRPVAWQEELVGPRSSSHTAVTMEMDTRAPLCSGTEAPPPYVGLIVSKNE